MPAKATTRSTSNAASAKKGTTTVKKAPAKKAVAKKTAVTKTTKKTTATKKVTVKKTTSPSAWSYKAKSLNKILSTDITKGKHLVIVESPAKGRTIGGFLGKNVDVQASFGHVADLPAKTLGVDVADGFLPTYEISPEKKKVVAELKRRAQEADGVWLATDEDREGEAIAWHIAQTLGLDIEKTPRIVFHEITKEAINRAVQEPRTIDMNLVDAQQARRVLDRLVGFSVSPVLWTKIKRGLSAGRVQSVAVKLIIEREREITWFKPEESWKLFASLCHTTWLLEVQLTKVDGKEPQAANYADVETILQPYGVSMATPATPGNPEEPLVCDYEKSFPFSLTDITIKQGKKNPSAPFITSTLQAEASRRFGWSVKQVMSVAQRLYESGYITYMRTDSTNLSWLAIGAAKNYITNTYGPKYHQVRQFASKSKNAQEAHEAIRPTYIDRTPEKSGLGAQEGMLYRLIWQRTVASQMASAEVELTTYAFTPQGIPHTWTAQGSVITFEWFLVLYGKQTQEEQDETDKQDDGETLLPKLSKGTSCTSEHILAQQNFTKPPSRYTESALVKALESRGIGRPSTYAPTISTIQDRGYIEKQDDKKLYPLEISFHVNDYLQEHFSTMMDYDFTAQMEDSLDEIGLGNIWRQTMMQEFYGPFSAAIQEAKKWEKAVVAVGKHCPTCADWQLIYKFTRFGKFIWCDHYPECTYTEKSQEEQDALAPLKEKYEGKPCPEGGTIVVKMGRFWPFLTSSLYPEVKWITSIPDEALQALEASHGGGVCPDCGTWKLVVKKARRGNYFLACNRYPDCKHAENIPWQPGGWGGARSWWARKSFRKTATGSRTSAAKKTVKKTTKKK
jgi:DNA topoisomerase I